VTLNNLVLSKIKRFSDLFAIFWLWRKFEERFALKWQEINQDNLHTKFSTLNVEFSCLNFGRLGLTSSS